MAQTTVISDDLFKKDNDNFYGSIEIHANYFLFINIINMKSTMIFLMAAQIHVSLVIMPILFTEQVALHWI